MIYLNEKDILKIGIDWNKTIEIINEAVKCYAVGDYTQPIKPYLRYKNLKNRIIAMPAFLGGNFNVAGIKWIASFPENIKIGKPRANSIIVLNNADTGEIMSSINTSLISIIRTASVSGLIIKNFIDQCARKNLTVGIIGWGPIGKFHYKMCSKLFGNKINKYCLYDLKKIEQDNIDETDKDKIIITDSWQEAYKDSDIVITCTVSDSRYIDQIPKEGSLLLNVSLRDFKPKIFEYVKGNIVVDDWEEVCRENTDIEMFQKECGLQKNDTKTIVDILNEKNNFFINKRNVMFNPMGMAIFDLAISKYYFDLAKQNMVGLLLT
ncbi:MAG: 2,3-diaminopropionate biosynthesis protein SbnB [Minisyncoccia bacterium]